MNSSAEVRLHIGNAIPPGNENETDDIIGLWKEIDGFFSTKPFSSRSGVNDEASSYHISMDARPLIKALEHAKTESGSFTAHQQAYIDDADKAIDGELVITIVSKEYELEEEESYQVAIAFIQQLVMAVNVACPGSTQILNARFAGTNSHRYEAQEFDARIFHGALRTSIENEWPKLQKLAFDKVWHWLEATEVSQTYTAIKSINKVLFTLLKVAEQRHEYSARTALLVMYQIEILLDCRQFNSMADVQNRICMILDDIPQATEWLYKLQDVRNNLFIANQPVHPPALICHTSEKILRKQLNQQSSPVEAGAALVLNLLQDLAAHDAHSYNFTESFTRA